MNRRNAEYILDHNPRCKFPLVDDKYRLAKLCARIGVSSPALYSVVSSCGQLRHLPMLLKGLTDFVIKPNRGSAGRGILVVTGRAGQDFLRHNGTRIQLHEIRQQITDVLSGMYSLGGQPDDVLIQQRVRLHPDFGPVSYKGIPDIRVILYRNQPAMAMLRLPTKASAGRANLHQGGIGAGIDLDTGVTHHAVLFNRAVTNHPDTHSSVVGLAVPHWREVLAMSAKVAQATGLGYLGVDIVVDATAGPLLLEANARPGLAIQIANGQGLARELRRIDLEAATGQIRTNQAQVHLKMDQNNIWSKSA